MYSVVFFGMVQRGLLITLLFRLEQNHSGECKSSPLTTQTLPLQQNLPSASFCLLLFSSSSCDTCSVIIKVIFYIWLLRKWQAANPATSAFISAFQLLYNLASAFAEMERKKSGNVSINHVSHNSELWPVQEYQPRANSVAHGKRRCLETKNVAARLGCGILSVWTLQNLKMKTDVTFISDISEKKSRPFVDDSPQFIRGILNVQLNPNLQFRL